MSRASYRPRTRYQVHVRSTRADRALHACARRAAERTLSVTDTPSGELTVVLAGEEEVRSLNRRFSGLDRATDVLSFPSGVVDPDTARVYHGDVVIAVPVARRQAARAGHSLAEEVQLLVIHGVLHLRGFDHGGSAERRRMWSIQRSIQADLRKAELPDKEKR